MKEKTISYRKYIDGILTFDEAFEGMAPWERYSLLDAQKLEIPNREKMISTLEDEKIGLKESIAKYRVEMEKHINRLDRAKNSISEILEDSKKNLKKYAHVLEAGFPKE